MVFRRAKLAVIVVAIGGFGWPVDLDFALSLEC